MIVVGLAGPAGSGKSAVAKALAARPGVTWIDLDAVAWETYVPGTAVHRHLVERFGPGIRRADGTIDRSALGRIVFQDEAARRDLDSIVHPAVTARLRTLAAEHRWGGTRVLLVEGALLTESPHVDRHDYDVLIFLEADEEVRRERLRIQGRVHHVERGRDLRPGSGAEIVRADGALDDVADRVWAVIERHRAAKPVAH